MARKVVHCPYCSATNGTVKKAGALKIIHDKFRAKKTAEEMEKWKKTFAPAIEAQKELSIYINKAVHEELNPLKVLDLFRRICDEVGTPNIAPHSYSSLYLKDCELLGLQPEWGRPEEFIWQYLSVPPVCIRPSVAQDGASNEDDLTVKLTEIVFTNALIKQGLIRGAPTPQFMVGSPVASRFCHGLITLRRNNGNFFSFLLQCMSTQSFRAYLHNQARNRFADLSRD